MKTRFSLMNSVTIMTIWRAVCFTAFLFFGGLSVRVLFDLRPYWSPNPYGSPEGLIFLLPMLFIYGSLSLSGLYGSWRSHRILRGDLAPARGRWALLEALAWIICSFGLLGEVAEGLIMAIGFGIDRTFWQLSLVFLGLTIVGVAGLASFYAAFRALGRLR